MGKSIWTVTPDTRTIDGLVFVDEDGNRHAFWIKVKKKLNEGERRKLLTAGFGGMRSESQQTDKPEIGIDWESMGFARVEVYLVDWSLEDDDKNRLAVKRDVIASLHPEVYKAVEDAVAQHVKELEAAKKPEGGASGPRAMSA